MKYKCKVAGCLVTPRGNDLGRHYKNNKDWSPVARLREAVGDDAVKKCLEGADGHTEFINRKGYTETSLPTFSPHVAIKVEREPGEGHQPILKE